MFSLLPAPLPASTPCCLAALDGLLPVSHTAGLLASDPAPSATEQPAQVPIALLVAPSLGALLSRPRQAGAAVCLPRVLSLQCCLSCRMRPWRNPSRMSVWLSHTWPPPALSLSLAPFL